MEQIIEKIKSTIRILDKLSIYNEEHAKQRKTMDWRMYFLGKSDAYELAAKELKEIIKKFNNE